MIRLFSLLTCVLFSACSEYDITPSTDEPSDLDALVGDTGVAVTSDTGLDTGDPVVTGDSAEPEVVDESCNGADDDGDGQTDEDLPTEPCEVSNDFGTCAGDKVCQGADGWSCSAAGSSPSPDIAARSAFITS